MAKLENLSMNPLDGPIPGMSLAKTPGESPWERPPQFTAVEDAMEYLYKELLRPKKYKPLIHLLKKKVPLEAVAKTILFAGFMEGKWTYDMVVLMAKPTLQMLTAFSLMLNMKPEVAMPSRLEQDSDIKTSLIEEEITNDRHKPQEQAPAPATGGGFMASPRG